MNFKLHSDYKPAGDQPRAIEQLTAGVESGEKYQTLLGVTGSGKTFTMANVIQNTQKPTLVIAHNKTLAAQLCNEFREFFPENAVEYFVSYYDYYQPEAYMPRTDTYIEKESQINEEIDRLRHSATQALLSRRDVIIVASVSCIYALGSPDEYKQTVLHVEEKGVLEGTGIPLAAGPDLLELSLRQGAGVREEPPDQGALAVVHMADDHDVELGVPGIGADRRIHRSKTVRNRKFPPDPGRQPGI